MEAINRVIIDFASETKRSRIQEKETSVMIILDVKNAFNTAARTVIDKVLKDRRVNENIIRVIRS